MSTISTTDPLDALLDSRLDALGLSAPAELVTDDLDAMLDARMDAVLPTIGAGPAPSPKPGVITPEMNTPDTYGSDLAAVRKLYDTFPERGDEFNTLSPEVLTLHARGYSKFGRVPPTAGRTGIVPAAALGMVGQTIQTGADLARFAQSGMAFGRGLGDTAKATAMGAAGMAADRLQNPLQGGVGTNQQAMMDAAGKVAFSPPSPTEQFVGEQAGNLQQRADVFRMLQPEDMKTPYTPAWFAAQIAGSVPQMAATVGTAMAGAAVGGPVGAFFGAAGPTFFTEGGQEASAIYAARKQQGATDDEALADAFMPSVATGLLNAGIEIAGPEGQAAKNLLGGQIRSKMKQIGRSVVQEGGEEMIQGTVSDLAQAGATGVAPNLDDFLEQRLQEGIVGGVMGGGFGAGAAFLPSIRDGQQQKSKRDLDLPEISFQSPTISPLPGTVGAEVPQAAPQAQQNPPQGVAQAVPAPVQGAAPQGSLPPDVAYMVPHGTVVKPQPGTMSLNLGDQGRIVFDPAKINERAVLEAMQAGRVGAGEQSKPASYTTKDLAQGTEAAREGGGISSNVRSAGLQPAFIDRETGKVYPSMYPPNYANRGDPAKPAPTHNLDGLPAEVVTKSEPGQNEWESPSVLEVKGSIEPGFIDDGGKFYTRDEAAKSAQSTREQSPPTQPPTRPDEGRTVPETPDNSETPRAFTLRDDAVRNELEKLGLNRKGTTPQVRDRLLLHDFAQALPGIGFELVHNRLMTEEEANGLTASTGDQVVIEVPGDPKGRVVVGRQKATGESGDRQNGPLRTDQAPAIAEIHSTQSPQSKPADPQAESQPEQTESDVDSRSSPDGSREPWEMSADEYRDANRADETERLTKITGDAYRIGKTVHIRNPGEPIPAVGNTNSKARLPVDAKVGDEVYGVSGKHRVVTVGKVVGGSRVAPDLMDVYRSLTSEHRAAVERAIAAGKITSHPDYPELSVGNTPKPTEATVKQSLTVAPTGNKATPVEDAGNNSGTARELNGNKADAPNVAGGYAESSGGEAPSKPATDKGAFDEEAWNRRQADIEDAIELSKLDGNVHLDEMPKYVESLRGKTIRSIRDGSTGKVATVANTGDVVVWWADEKSANNNLATQKSIKVKGMRKPKSVWESWVIPSDQADFVVEGERRKPDSIQQAKDRQRIIERRRAAGKSLPKDESQPPKGPESAPKGPESEVGTSAAETPKWGIYRVRIKDQGERFAVRESGHANGFGDTLHKTEQEARQYSSDAKDRDQKNAESRAKEAAAKAERDTKEQAAKAVRDDTDGFADSLPALQRGKVIKTLDAMVSLDGKADSLKEHVRRMVKSPDLEFSTREENKIKPPSRVQWNRMDGSEQAAHERKVAAAGKHAVYRINGYDLGKTAYDYAKFLNDKQSQPAGESAVRSEFKRTQDEIDRRGKAVEKWITENDGVAFTATTRETGREIAFTPSAKEAGKWQVTRFGKDGKPSGDTVYSSYAEAVRTEGRYGLDMATAKPITGTAKASPEPRRFTNSQLAEQALIRINAESTPEGQEKIMRELEPAVLSEIGRKMSGERTFRGADRLRDMAYRIAQEKTDTAPAQEAARTPTKEPLNGQEEAPQAEVLNNGDAAKPAKVKTEAGDSTVAAQNVKKSLADADTGGRWNAMDYGQRQDIANRTEYKGSRKIVHRMSGSKWHELGAGERSAIHKEMKESGQNDTAKSAKPESLAKPESKPEVSQSPSQSKPAGILSNLSAEKQARAAELQKRLRAKLNNETRAGFDPEMFAIGAELASIYIESGAKHFKAFASRMVADIGDSVVPYLKSFYNGARDMPGVESEGMTPAAEVSGMSENDIREAAREGTIEDQEQTNGETQDDNQGRRDSVGTDAVDSDGGGPSGGERSGSDGVTGGEGDAAGPSETEGKRDGESGGKAKKGRAGRGSSRGGRGGVSGTTKGRTERGRKGDAVSSESDLGEIAKELAERRADLPRAALDHRIQESDKLIVGSGKAKAEANLRAIKLWKKLTEEDRLPTADEKRILAQYTGWGDTQLKPFLDRLKLQEIESNKKYGYGNDPEVMAWDKKYGELARTLRDTLTEEEYRAAAASTANAHYTSRDVITNGLWAIARRLGFKGGHVLENSAGIGHVVGLIPDDLQKSSFWTMVELDETSSGLLKMLYPEELVHRSGFEDAKIPNNTVDLVIGNPPFHKQGPSDENLPNFSLHNYMLAKSIMVAKPGALVVQITSSSTLDNPASAKFREWASAKADLVGAIRLPNDAFQENAGTEVTTDILVFRKKDSTTFRGEPWLNVRDMDTEAPKKWNEEDGPPPTTVPVNEYYHLHPEMMLGTMGLEGTMYGPYQAALVANPGQDTLAMLRKAVESLPADVMTQTKVKRQKVGGGTASGKEFAFSEKDGRVYQQIGGELVVPEWAQGKSGKLNESRAKGLIGLRESTRVLIDSQLDEDVKDSDLEAQRKSLKSAYERFVKKNGRVNDKANASLFSEDPEWALLSSLESVEETYDGDDESAEVLKTKITPRQILEKRTQWPPKPPTSADSPADAVAISESWRGTLDMDYVAELRGVTREEAVDELLNNGLAFRDPDTGLVVSREEYLSENVREKLKRAEEEAKTDSEYARNVEALKPVIPADLPISQVSVQWGAGWVTPEAMQAWTDHLFGVTNKDAHAGEFTFDESVGRYSVKWNSQLEHLPANAVTHASGSQKAARLLEDGLTMTPTVVKEKVVDDNGNEKYVTDQKQTEAAQDKQRALFASFERWARTSDYAEGLARTYNDLFNSTVPRVYPPPKFERFPGQSEAYYAHRPHQLRAVMRAIRNSIILGHDVGAGKTMVFVSTVMEWKRLGLATKPMISVMKANVGQIVDTFKEMYPQARILTPSSKDFEPGNRKKLFARIATGDYDAIIVTHEQMVKVEDDPARMKGWINEQIKMLEMKLISKRQGQRRAGKKDTSQKAVEDAIKRLKDVLAKVTNRKVDSGLTFEQLGIDGLVVDESHKFKKIYFDTDMENIKGLDTAYSQRGLSLLMKARWVQQKNNNRNIMMSTGTPVTNTIAEAWNVMRLVRPDLTSTTGMSTFDQFAGQFSAVLPDAEIDAAGRFKEVRRLTFNDNVRELSRLFAQVADMAFLDDMPEIKRPKIKGGKPESIEIKAGPVFSGVMNDILAVLEWYEGLTGKAKRENRHVPLMMDGRSRAAAIDVRLFDPTLPKEKGGKLDVAADNIFKRWEDSKDKSGTQLVFTDRYKSPEKEVDGYDDDGEAIYKKIPQERRFNFFDALRDELVARGIPREQIAHIGDFEGDTKTARAKKAAIFQAMNDGKIRVLMGTTERLGTGVNVQRRVMAMHHLDAPYRPSDREQRDGRGVRQGNMFDEIEVVEYGMVLGYDAGGYQRLARKRRAFQRFLKGTLTSENMKDLDDEGTAGYEEAAAAFSGDPLIRERFVAKKEISRLRMLEAAHADEVYSAKSKVREIERTISDSEQKIATNERFIEANKGTIDDPSEAKISVSWGEELSKDEEKEFFERQTKSVSEMNPDSDDRKNGHIEEHIGSATIGGIKGTMTGIQPVGWKDGKKTDDAKIQFKFSVGYGGGNEYAQGSTPQGFRQSFSAALKRIAGTPEYLRNNIETATKTLEALKEQAEAPFVHADALEKAQTKFDIIKEKLAAKNKDGSTPSKEDIEDFKEKFKDKYGTEFPSSIFANYKETSDDTERIGEFLDSVGDRRAKAATWIAMSFGTNASPKNLEYLVENGAVVVADNPMIRAAKERAKQKAAAQEKSKEKARAAKDEADNPPQAEGGEDASGPTSAPPGQDFRRFTERLDERIDEIRSRRNRRQLPRGRNIGAGVIGSEIRDAATIAFLQAVKAGAIAGRALTKAVAAALKSYNSKADPKKVRKVVRGLIKDAGIVAGQTPDMDRVDRAIADLRTQTRKPAQSTKQTIAQNAGPTAKGEPEFTAAETEKIKYGYAAKAAKQSFREGQQDQVRTFQNETLPKIRHKMMLDSLARQGAAFKAGENAGAEEAKFAREQVRGIRKTLVDEIRQLPPAVRGKFLTHLRDVKTYDQLRSALDAIERESLVFGSGTHIRQAAKMGKDASLLKLPEEDENGTPVRSEVRKWLADAAAQWEELQKEQERHAKGPGVIKGEKPDARRKRRYEHSQRSLAKIRQLAADIKANVDAAREQFHYEKRKFSAYVKGQKVQAAVTRRAMVDSAKANQKPLKESDVTDATKPFVLRRLIRYSIPIASLAKRIDMAWKGDGTWYNVLVQNFTDANRKKIFRYREIAEASEKVAEAAGYKSMSDAHARLSGTYGKKYQEMVTVEIGGKKRRIPKGAAMDLWAHATDASTSELLANGQTINFRRNKMAEDQTVNVASVYRALTPQERAFVEQMKAVKDTMFAEMDATNRRLKGTSLDRQPGHWSRTRNSKMSEKIGQTDVYRNTSDFHLDNSGFLKQRTGGRVPIIIGDFLEGWHRQTNAMMQFTYLSEPVRWAEQLALHPDVKPTIVSLYGEQMIRRIERGITDASGTSPFVELSWLQNSIRTITARVGRALTSVNWRSWAKNLGGTFKIMAKMPMDAWRHGVQGMFKKGVLTRMMKYSADFWHRWNSSPHSRHTGVMDSADALEGGHFVEGAKKTIGNLFSLDLMGADAALQQTLNTIKVSNAFDSVPARVAWAGWEWQVEQDHPTWSHEQKMEWVANEAWKSFSESQNTTGGLDSSATFSDSRRDPFQGALMQFTSDSSKSLAMLYDAAHQGAGEKAKTAAAIALNAAWATAVVGASGKLLWSAIAAMMGGEPDWEDAEKQAAEGAAWQAAQEAGNIIPGIGPAIEKIRAVSAPFRRASVMDNPAAGSMDDLLNGLSELVVAPFHEQRIKKNGVPYANSKTAFDKIWSATYKTLRAAATVEGIPVSPFVRDIKGVVDAYSSGRR